MTRPSPYRWIVDRARSGEPVPIDTDRRDMGRILDFLESVDGRGLSMQLDTKARLMWVCLADTRPSREQAHA